MPTLKQIRQRVGEMTGLMVYPLPTFQTAAAQYLQSDALIDTDASASWFNRHFLYRPDSSAANRLRQVSSYTTSNGRLTHAGQAYSDTDLTGETPEIWQIDPRLVNSAINRAIIKCLREAYTPLSIWTEDPDMENSGTADWTASNATLAKSTSVVYRGRQSLAITATAANGFARTPSIDVTPGASYWFFAVVAARGGSVVVQAYDATNNAVIEALTVSDRDWRYVSTQFTVPATCRQVQIRIVQQSNGEIAYLDQLGGWQADQMLIPAPPWLDDKDNVLDVLQWLTPASGDPISREAGMKPVSWYDVVFQRGAAVPVWLTIRNLGSGPVIVRAQRPYAVLNDETDNTTATLDWVATGAAWQLYDYLSTTGRVPQSEKVGYLQEARAYESRWLAWCQSEQPNVPRRQVKTDRPFGVRVM
jgi:hypothetical protein